MQLSDFDLRSTILVARNLLLMTWYYRPTVEPQFEHWGVCFTSGFWPSICRKFVSQFDRS